MSRREQPDCLQSLRSCKGRAAFLPNIAFPDALDHRSGPHRRRVQRDQRCPATPPLDIVSFLLTPQAHRTQNPRNFSVSLLVQAARAGTSRRRLSAAGSTLGGNARSKARRPQGRGERAVFAGMDGAVHQSGVSRPWPLAACQRFRRRTLQQLQRATSQCSAAARPSPAAASSLARQLPSPGAFPRAFAVASAAEPDGPARPGQAGASRPRRNLCLYFVFL